MKQKQLKFLEAYISQPTISDAAKVAGITRATAYSYLKDEGFRKELQKRQNECIDDAIRFLQGKLTFCSETLIDIINSPETAPQVKVNAITTVINCYKTFNESKIISRIERLEMLTEGRFEDDK